MRTRAEDARRGARTHLVSKMLHCGISLIVALPEQCEASFER